ncbi:MAG: putative integral membrane protein (TIGR00698 family) [Salibacteraceae bacterium]|jgi:uncharacterized integral membrane protein (TIGR00698 family)
MKTIFFGIAFSLVLGTIAYAIAPFIPVVNSIVLALVLGILVANIFQLPKIMENGIQFSGKQILEWAIIFLGFGVSFQDIANVGWPAFWTLIITIIMVLLFSFYWLRNNKTESTSGYLIGFGTAICGSSAIAALAPKISATRSDIGISIAVINLFGLLGMISIPVFLSDSINIDWIGLFIGGTLHGVSNVAGAGYAMNETIGDLALTIKLGRVALLAPSLIFFNFLINKTASIKENLKLPYYIVGFIAATATVSIFSLPIEILDAFRSIGKLLLTISMAAIGLGIQFSTLITNGKSALKFGLLIFVIQLVLVGLLGFIL